MLIKKFAGDMFWSADDTEYTVFDPEDELDERRGLGNIVEFEQAKRLPNFFGVDCGDDTNGHPIYEFYTTREEAEVRAAQVQK